MDRSMGQVHSMVAEPGSTQVQVHSRSGLEHSTVQVQGNKAHSMTAS